MIKKWMILFKKDYLPQIEAFVQWVSEMLKNPFQLSMG